MTAPGLCGLKDRENSMWIMPVSPRDLRWTVGHVSGQWFLCKMSVCSFRASRRIKSLLRGACPLILPAAISIAVGVTKNYFLTKILKPVLPQGHSEINCKESAESLISKWRGSQAEKQLNKMASKSSRNRKAAEKAKSYPSSGRRVARFVFPLSYLQERTTNFAWLKTHKLKDYENKLLGQ